MNNSVSFSDKIKTQGREMLFMDTLFQWNHTIGIFVFDWTMICKFSLSKFYIINLKFRKQQYLQLRRNKLDSVQLNYNSIYNRYDHYGKDDKMLIAHLQQKHICTVIQFFVHMVLMEIITKVNVSIVIYYII